MDKADIIICDNKENYRFNEYENNLWSGLRYMLNHNNKDKPNCPIVTEIHKSLGGV